MSGPGATVLLPRPFTDADMRDLSKIVSAVSERASGPPAVVSAFSACDTTSIGGKYVGEGRPFAIELNVDVEKIEMASHASELASAFGVEPEAELVTLAFCSQSSDHQILGEITLALAERFGGVIDYGGALWPLLPPGLRIDDHPDWHEIEPYFERAVSDMPGKVISVVDVLPHVPPWPSHVSDAVFLRAWIEDSRFQMVK
jgi:hypothetical protein